MIEILQEPLAENNKKTSLPGQLTDSAKITTATQTPPLRDSNHLIHDHWHMATHIANNYRNIPGVDFDDILQHARLALIKAAHSYNSTHRILFSTFAWCSIRNELNSLYVRQKKYSYRELYITHRSPDQEEIPLAYITPSPELDAYESLSRKELFLALEKSLQTLPRTLRKVIREIMTGRGYKEIGNDLGYSEASSKTLVSRAYKRALCQLRIEMEKMGYDPSCLN